MRKFSYFKRRASLINSLEANSNVGFSFLNTELFILLTQISSAEKNKQQHSI